MATIRTVSPEARKILARCMVEHDEITLPNEQLDRPLYLEVNSVLEALGGKWIRSRKSHVFGDPNGVDLADAFYSVVETGTWERPQDAGYYPTPGWLVEQMVNALDVELCHRVLEPSAGQGAILSRLVGSLGTKDGIEVCELLPKNRKILDENGYQIVADDFLDLRAGPVYDRIIMNPPFGKSQAPSHVRHAITHLKPGGRLVAIMPSSIIQRQDRLHRAVRYELMMNGTIVPLPEDTFRDAGTMVRTVMVVYNRPSDPSYDPFPVGPKIVGIATPEQPQDGSLEPPGAPETNGTAPGAPRRFRRLTDTPRRFRKLKRRGNG